MHSMKLQGELTELYTLLSKMCIVCIRKDLRLIVENPRSQPHYLTQYWPLKPAVIENDRSLNGDEQKKPTQYWFIGCSPENNIMVDCLKGKDMAMNLEPTSEGGYDGSHLRESLNQEILALFPDDIREAMVPVYRDDLLTIPSEMEIFGERIFSKEDSKDEQLEPMKEMRNRIALGGMDGYPNWYWLRDATSASAFARVNGNGYANGRTATASLGIRPRFRIANR